MISGKKIPFVNENTNMKKALKLITEKKLRFLIAIIEEKLPLV